MHCESQLFDCLANQSQLLDKEVYLWISQCECSAQNEDFHAWTHRALEETEELTKWLKWGRSDTIEWI